MKKVEANRYPHSATLFKFCKQALEMRYDGNVKVIDQDVGAILGYDPADCSHWKKGKKNIKALSTLQSIAEHLNCDERLLIDIASGRVDYSEAVFEYKGYGHTSIGQRHLEHLKKEFFRDPAKWQKTPGVGSFDELFHIDRSAVVTAANQVLAMGSFTESPIYIPEVFDLFPGISMSCNPEQDEEVKTTYVGEGQDMTATVMFKQAEMKPYMRYLLLKELFRFLCLSKNEMFSMFATSPVEVIDVSANIFAGAILVPEKLLKKEVDELDSSLDLVSQLADTFWVSKGLLNQRLRDFLESI